LKILKERRDKKPVFSQKSNNSEDKNKIWNWRNKWW